MERKDWALLAIAAAQGDSLDPAQLQKSLFLLGKSFPRKLGKFYRFSPYHYGPFDGTVYRDAEELAELGLVTISAAGSARRYTVTAAGMDSASEVRNEVRAEAAAYLATVVDWARSLSFSALVRAIYAEYPEQRENSVFSG